MSPTKTGFLSPRSKGTAKSPPVSPNQSGLIRSKSNTEMAKLLNENKNSTRNNRNSLKTLPQEPEEVITEFIKNKFDIKSPLDLTKCQLNDDLACRYLKEARAERRITGLKLADN